MSELPMVSICTPTFNRRPFLDLLIKSVIAQTYPIEKIEWVICDDGTDCVRDVFEKLSFCKYFQHPKIPLGEKRNYLHNRCSGEIIINMDDDDYYPPTRISHAVEQLYLNPTIMIAGSSMMYMYSYSMQKVYECGPYGKNHCTAATMAFRRELLELTGYDNKSIITEETTFLKKYTIPLIQLDPLKTILVFSHEQNSCNKEELISMGKYSGIVESNISINDFLKDENSKNEYLYKLPKILKEYDDGSIVKKPEIVAEMKNRRETCRNRRKRDIIEKIERDEISFEAIEQFMSGGDKVPSHLTTLLENKNKLIDKLLDKVKTLTPPK